MTSTSFTFETFSALSLQTREELEMITVLVSGTEFIVSHSAHVDICNFRHTLHSICIDQRTVVRYHTHIRTGKTHDRNRFPRNEHGG